MRFGLRFGLAFLAVLFATAFSTKSGEAVAKWPAACIHITPTTHAEAPLIDGHPDYQHVSIVGVLLDTKCFQYEVRH